jgi:hypothetical protein
MEEQILQQSSQAGASAPGCEAGPQLADISPDERARLHYIDVIQGLLKEALTTKTLPVLSKTMTLYLGWLFVEYGPPAAGHVLEQLGSQITYFYDSKCAEKEAEEARKEGRVAH